MGRNPDTADKNCYLEFKNTQMRPMHFQILHKVMGGIFCFLRMEILAPL